MSRINGEAHWWDTMPIERHHYRAYRESKKAAKIFAAMMLINKIKAECRPQKKLNRGVVVLGARQPT